MKSRHMLIVVALVLTAEGAGRADFVLTGTEHLDVTTSHTTGTLFDASTADVLAGGYIITNVYVNDEARLRVMRPSGGAVYTAWAHNTGRIAISSGDVYSLFAYETSSADISGGGVSYLDAYETSSVDISGGSVSYLKGYDASSVAISGGEVSHLDAYGTSNITLHGYDFGAAAGLSLVGDEVIGTGVLTGKSFDGTSWIIDIGSHSAGATIRTSSDPAQVLLPGDADCNRTVDLADLSIVAFNWDTQSGAIWQMGDFDGDGDVDLSDLSALAFNWGESYANPPVPEPASALLLGFGAMFLPRRRQRSRQV